MPLQPTSLLDIGSYSSSMSGLGSPARLVSTPGRAIFELNVSKPPSSSAFATSTLDVWLQHSLDAILCGPASSNGTATWDDFGHFSQVAAGGATQRLLAWNGAAAPSSSVASRIMQTAALGAGVVINGPTGCTWRVQYTVANGPSAPSSSQWQFSVLAQVQ